MNSDKAGSIVLGTMVGAMGIAVVHDLTTRGNARYPAMRIGIGGTVATMMLLGLAGPAPDVAAALGTLVFMGTLFGPQGEAVLTTITKVVNTNQLGGKGFDVAAKSTTPFTSQPITKMGRPN